MNPYPKPLKRDRCSCVTAGALHHGTDRKDAESTQLVRTEVEKMCWREYAVGYGSLVGYLCGTEAAGMSFFSLQPDHRALWLAGAVMVLGIIGLRGWHSAGS